MNRSPSRRGWTQILRAPRSTLYLAPPGERRVCFFDTVAVRYQYSEHRAQIWSMESDAAFEALYYVILSYVGERLDELGWHRLHGFGFAAKRRAVVMASSGTGKSTLAWRLLREPGFSFYSDDTPLISRRGEIAAFPQRIALEKVPEGAGGRAFKRARNKTKYVMGFEAFSDRIAKKGALQDLYWLRKSYSSHGIQKAPRYQFVIPLLKWLVLGYETPQIWELYLRLSPSDIVRKIRILRSRLWAAHRLLWDAEHFTMDRDSKRRTAESLLKHATA
ncbi:MAG: hypothetical protein KDD51_12995 [Bdellovibrionales bacterium]|nr:hypothetical protein [Bdellovibrionales bacterium]